MMKKVGRDTKVASKMMMKKMMITRVTRMTRVMRKTKGLISGKGDDDNGKSRDPYGVPLTTTVYINIAINSMIDQYLVYSSGHVPWLC